MNSAIVDTNLDLEDVEGLIRTSTVRKGGRRGRTQQSHLDLVMAHLCSTQNRKKLMMAGFAVAILLLLIASNAGGGSAGEGGNSKEPENVNVNAAAAAGAEVTTTTLPVSREAVQEPQSTDQIIFIDPSEIHGAAASVNENVVILDDKPKEEEEEENKITVIEADQDTIKFVDPAQQPPKEEEEPKDGGDTEQPPEQETKPDEMPDEKPAEGGDDGNEETKSGETPEDNTPNGNEEKKPDDGEEGNKPDEKAEPETEAKPDLPKRNAKIPVLEPDLMAGPIPEEKWATLADKWGHWHFWDGDAEMRPDDSFVSEYPNRDVPGENFPENAWQTDAVYVNHYLDGADKLIDRAMEAIFTEYGHGKPLPPEEMKNRMRMFHWEKLDLGPDEGQPPMFSKRGQREIGGWTTKRSFDGLVKRLLHAMMTKDTFTVVLGGHSAAQGMGNHFRQSYAMQFHRIMKPIFERLGVKLITRNMSQGGLGTLQAGMGAADIYGRDIDIFLWDSGMTEGGAPHHVDLVLRQVLIGGNRVPLIWGGNFDILKMLHNEADVDVGEFGTGYAGIPETEDEEQAKTLPWAAQRMRCTSERSDLCNEDRYNATCWVDRPDGITPKTGQRARPKGQVKWHPGWRPHQLMGRVLTFAVLEGLEVAVNTWMDATMTGQPLDDDYWHMTEYYENIRNKVKNLDPSLGYCYQIEGTLPTRMCKTPMNSRTQYTPRQDYDASSITSLIKPASNGWVPKNEKKALYEGPDVHLPAFDVPEGEVDVLSIIMGRRRLKEIGEEMAVEKTIPSSSSSSVSPFENKVVADDAGKKPIRGRELEGEGKITDEPGEGWEIFGEPQGYCDGTYDAVCSRSTDEECVLLGHHDGRGAVVGNEWAGWLIMNIPAVKEGIIVVKLHSWHYPEENPKAKNWKSVNGKRRLGATNEGSSEAAEEVGHYASDLAYPEIEQMVDNKEEGSEQRRILTRSYETRELPETFMFDYAINGEITSLNSTQFLAKKQNLQRVVETMTLVDDPEFAKDGAKDVEVAFRLRGVGNGVVFGVSHMYWA